MLRKILAFAFFFAAIPAFTGAVSVSSPYIAIYGDDSTMIFGLYTSPTYALPNASLTYPSSPSASMTSHLVFNNGAGGVDVAGMTTLAPMTAFGSGLGAYVEGTKTYNNMNIQMHYEVVNNPLTGLLADTMMVRLRVTNTGATASPWALRMEIDTMVNSIDGANISVDNGVSTIATNTAYHSSPGPIPDSWWIYDVPPPGIANLVGRSWTHNNPFGLAATQPDVMEVAYWGDAAGTGQWTLAPVGTSITDSAVVYWWTGSGSESSISQNLNPGQTAEVITYYGINQGALLNTPTPAGSKTSTPTATPSSTASPTFTVTPTLSPTFTPSPTATVTLTCTRTLTFTPTPTFSVSPTITPTFSISPTFTVTPTAIPDDPGGKVEMIGVYPHPIPASGTVFAVRIPIRGELVIKIYTLKGETAKTITKTFASAGAYEIPWDVRNEAGNAVSFGSYFVQATMKGIGNNSKAGKWIAVLR